jgi:hypothetical protein
MPRLFLLLAPLLLSAAVVHALDVAGYDSAANDRFSSGYPDAPVPNSSPKFIGKDFDWSGVGWWKKDPHFSVTLLSSKNFACTRHMQPQIGDVITFFGRDGHLHDYHVAKLQLVPLGTQNGQPVYADTAIGTFAETVAFDDQIAHYPVAFSPKGLAAFIGKKILMYGHMARLGTNQIVEGIMLENVASEYNFDTRGLTPGMAKSESGDSGSPSFVVISGELALVGTHWKVDTDSMVSGIIPGMNAITAADGARVEVLPIGD